MSFFSLTARTQITGLTASTWNRNVNVNSFAAIPVGATHVLLEVYHNSGTGAAYGFQVAGASPDNLFAVQSRFHRFEFINLNGGQLLDLYTGNTTSCRFFIRGYTDHINDVTPLDLTPQVIATNGVTVTCSSLPDDAAGGVAILEVNGLQVGLYPVGGSLQERWRHIERQIEIVPLNSSKQFVANVSVLPAANTLRLVGYMKSGAFVPASDTSAKSVTTINTWETKDWVDTNPISIFRSFTVGGSTSQLFGMNVGGATTGEASANANKANPHWQQPDGSGQFSIRAGATSVQVYHVGSIVASLSDIQINDIDQLIAGQMTTITFSDSYSPTAINISDGVYAFTITSITQVNATTVSFTCPTPTDGLVGCKLGAVNVTATDGSTTTAEYASDYSVTNFSPVELLSVDSENYADGRDPALEIGAQCIYQYSHGIVTDSGVFESSIASGTVNLYDRSPSDGIWRLVVVIIENVGQTTGGLTSIGLTAIGPSSTGLTAVGL